MEDIKTKEDIILMVDNFYSKVKIDPLLGPTFISKLGTSTWAAHLETMYSFWNTILLGQKDYRGSPFSKHSQMSIDQNHFERWITLFKETIEANFEGPKSKQALVSANKISLIFQAKLEQERTINNY